MDQTKRLEGLQRWNAELKSLLVDAESDKTIPERPPNPGFRNVSLEVAICFGVGPNFNEHHTARATSTVCLLAGEY